MSAILSQKEFMQTQDKAKAHNADACYRLGEHYYACSDFDNAFKWYKNAADCSDPNPCVYFNIGYAYQHGQGVASDIREAFLWYKRAAEYKLPQALYNLAYFYQNGLGIPEDQEKANYYIRLATEAMNSAQTKLYDMQEREERIRDELEQERNRSFALNIKNEHIETDRQQLIENSAKLKQEIAQLQQENSRLRQQLADLRENAVKSQQEAENFQITSHQAMKEQMHSAEEMIKSVIQNHTEETENLTKRLSAQIRKKDEETQKNSKTIATISQQLQNALLREKNLLSQLTEEQKKSKRYQQLLLTAVGLIIIISAALCYLLI